MFFFILSACSPEADPKDPTEEETEDTGQPDDTGPTDTAAWTTTETMTFELAVDVVGTMEGAPADCSYVRQYTGIELGSLSEAVCPDCRNVFMGYTELSEGSVDCYADWNPADEGSPAARMEAIGWSQGGLFRNIYWPLSVFPIDGWEPPAEGETIEIGYSTAIYAPFTAALDVVVTIVRGGERTRPDPEVDRTEPYTCGWSQNDPGDIEEPSSVEVGGTLPNEVMEDQCGEPFSLRDLYGEWVLFQYVWSDCDACVHTALEAQAVSQELDLTIVTLYFGTDAGWEEAKQTYGGFGPVLRDLGYGAAMAGFLTSSVPVVPSSWWLVDPSQTIQLGSVGSGDLASVREVM